GVSTNHVLNRRDKITFVPRGDRKYYDRKSIQNIRQVVERLQLKPVVTIQVQGDEQFARELSQDLEAIFIPWGHPKHSHHDRTIRELYGESQFVLSDRLHALIYAQTEG